ncbi:hypothetical protein ACH3Y9_13175 [Streptomyces sp. WSLK1-5]|uniref:hypothetical protein n=1 Tax=unclassified Streptomyces TaxID=2593676 RepID=UPI0037A8B993
MTRDADRRNDPADVTALLAAEAAVLEARLGMLQEAIAEVDARIRAVSEQIGRLPAAGTPDRRATGLAPSPAHPL